MTTAYVLSSPFVLVDTAKFYTPIFSFLLALFFFGLDEISVQLEEPFGDDYNDINMLSEIEHVEKETVGNSWPLL